MIKLDLTTRRAKPGDAAVISRHRRLMFEAMGHSDVGKLDAMEAAYVGWVRERLARDEYLGWLVVTPEGFAASGLGLWVRELPPNPADMCGRRGYIFNVYTYPDYRRRGLARQLIMESLAWCRDNGIQAVTLHYSEDGRSLYESIGFTVHNEMIFWTRNLASQPVIDAESTHA